MLPPPTNGMVIAGKVSPELSFSAMRIFPLLEGWLDRSAVVRALLPSLLQGRVARRAGATHQSAGAASGLASRVRMKTCMP